MKLHGLLSQLKLWFRGLPAVAEEDGTWASPQGPPQQDGDGGWDVDLTASEQREWQELVASARLGARLADKASERRREHRAHRRSGARRVAR